MYNLMVEIKPIINKPCISICKWLAVGFIGYMNPLMAPSYCCMKRQSSL